MDNSTSLKTKIFKETLVYSIGSFGSKIFSFLLAPFYTFFLTKEELGVYDLLITTISLFVPLVSLQLSDSTYRWLIDNNNNDEKRKIITNSLIGYFVNFILFLIGFILFNYFVSVQYSFYFIILLFFNGLLPFLQNILRGLGKTKEFAKNGIITSFFILFFNVLFIYVFKFQVEGILLANIVAYLIATCLIIIKIKLYKDLQINSFDKNILIKMLKYSLPLIPNLMSWWLIGSASKYIILHFLGADSNGLYAISSRFPSILIIINSVLVLPIQDGMLKKETNLVDYKDILYDFFKIEFSCILILIVVSPIFTKFIVSDTFYESWRYMGYLFIGVGFNTIGALLGLVYQKKLNTIKITVTTIIGSVVSIILSFVLINEYGLSGLSFAYMFGFLVMFFLRFIDTRKEFNLTLSYTKLIVSIALLIGFNILIQNINFYNQLYLATLVTVLVIYMNRKIIVNVIRKNR